jgi:hypothetical protein
MSRRPGRRAAATEGIAPVYEGPEVLAALLERAGSPHGTDEVADIFKRAQKAGEPRSAVIPGLFPAEPRFAGPDDARRLYSNLFGLWGRLAAGLGAHGDAPDAVPDPLPLPPLPERGSQEGDVLSPEVVDAVWRHLAAASPREVQRRRDQFMNVQPDLSAWLEAVPLPDAGGLAANDLVFEAWVMFDQAFGDRLDAVSFGDLRDIGKEPPPLEPEQPALAAYVGEELDEVSEDDEAFGPEERAQVERVVASAVAALAGAVRQPS